MPMRHRLLLFSAIVFAVALAVLLSRRSLPASATIAEPGGSSFRSINVSGSSVTTITTDTISILTYPYTAYLYTATNTTYNIPYQWLNWAEYNNSHPQPAEKTYTRLTLENDWLKVWLLPELGGRIYQIFFKPTNRGLLYTNWVLKPTNWGPPEQGWWLAVGGIEWGLPVEEHGYEWGSPWSYDIITGTTGITVTMRDSTTPDRLRAAVSIFLPNDGAALGIHPRIENDRNVDLNFKWWINAMIAPGYNSVGTSQYDYTQNVQFVYPTEQVTIHSTGDDSLPGPNYPSGPTAAMSWPIYNGRDLSYLRNWHQFLGFFARPAAQSDFAGVYNVNTEETDLKYGIARIFPHQIATGLKGFGMGWTNPLPWSLWSDTPSYYVEMHGGLAPTFWDSAFLKAHSAIEWDETWYPVAGLNGLTTGNAAAALHIAHAGPTEYNIDAGAYANRPLHNARFAVYVRGSTCDLMGERVTDLMTPATPLTLSLQNLAPVDNLTVLLTENDQFVATYHLVNNGHPPIASMLPLPTYVTQATFSIDLGASAENCLRSMDVQVRDGWDGQWTDWITRTTQSTQWFTGEDGHTYYFRVRALDWAGNQSAYTTNPFGDAFTSVLLTPAPVLDTSIKGVDSPLILGSPIGWSIDLWNTGNLSTTATLTDTLPPFTTILTDALWLNGAPAPQLYVDGQLRWSGNVTEDAHIHITYQLSPTLPLLPGTTLTNTAVISYDDRIVTRTAKTTQPYQIALPLIRRGAP